MDKIKKEKRKIDKLKEEQRKVLKKYEKKELTDPHTDPHKRIKVKSLIFYSLYKEDEILVT